MGAGTEVHWLLLQPGSSAASKVARQKTKGTNFINFEEHACLHIPVRGLGWGASFWSALHDPDICKVDGVSEGDSKALMSSWVEVKGRGALALGWDQPDPDYPQT